MILISAILAILARVVAAFQRGASSSRCLHSATYLHGPHLKKVGGSSLDSLLEERRSSPVFSRQAPHQTPPTWTTKTYTAPRSGWRASSCSARLRQKVSLICCSALHSIVATSISTMASSWIGPIKPGKMITSAINCRPKSRRHKSEQGKKKHIANSQDTRTQRPSSSAEKPNASSAPPSARRSARRRPRRSAPARATSSAPRSGPATARRRTSRRRRPTGPARRRSGTSACWTGRTASRSRPRS